MLIENKNETGYTCFAPGTYRCNNCGLVEREVADYATFPVCRFCHTGVHWLLVRPMQVLDAATAH